MSQQITLEQFKKELFEGLEETFEQERGIYLDKGTSLFETLESISAEDASRSIAENCATIAAQVEHVRFYLDVLNNMMQKEMVTRSDWRDIWERVREVTPEEWDAQKRRLKESYQSVLETIRNYERWENEFGIAGSLAVLTHTAYHLGGIRMTWAAIKSAQRQSQSRT
jgi:hypothetical protein